MKICFVASSGGHLEEMMCLKPIEERYDSIFVTEKSGFQIPKFGKKHYFIPQINRKEKYFFIHFLKLCIQAIHILKKENPKVVLTTGALIAFPFCLFGKLLGKKVIYIESFARVDKPSLTGKMVYRLADLFIVQWEDMLKTYKKAVYTGGIF